MSAATLRLAASAAITALAAVMSYYPHQVWIPAVIAAASAVGIHAIPAIQQKGNSMSEPTGPQLMGIQRPPGDTTSVSVPISPDTTENLTGAALMGVAAASVPQPPPVTAVTAPEPVLSGPEADAEAPEEAPPVPVTAPADARQQAVQALLDVAQTLTRVAQSL